MAEVVVGTSPTTGEVLVKDTATGDLSWQPGTESQVASVTAAIQAEEYGVPYTAPTYQEPEPEPEPVIPPVVPPVVPPTFPSFPSWSDIWSSLRGYLQAAVKAWNWVKNAPTRIWEIVENWWSAKSSEVWEYTWDRITRYVPNLIDIRNWFFDWIDNVTGVVDDWWSSTISVVRGLINKAKQDLQDLIASVKKALGNLQAAWEDFRTLTWPEWKRKFNTLSSNWDSFRTQTFPALATWSGVNNLIESALKDWFPFYPSLSQLWNSVAEFITDPLEYIWDRFADWFLGPEE